MAVRRDALACGPCELARPVERHGDTNEDALLQLPGGISRSLALASTGIVSSVVSDVAEPVRTVLITAGLVGVGARSTCAA